MRKVSESEAGKGVAINGTSGARHVVLSLKSLLCTETKGHGRGTHRSQRAREGHAHAQEALPEEPRKSTRCSELGSPSKRSHCASQPREVGRTLGSFEQEKVRCPSPALPSPTVPSLSTSTAPLLPHL